uniref:Nucleolar GTP-binding protein 2 n=1 Tax=Chrysotila carterae TaxID=13221 RepID=A0A7S4BJ68_CHRCT|mmetsp:Transcript_18125/g.39091  ORF Transcript_18125/g.39091 Transcript_18125/m.39091 type:complete len:642 (-) Transcript_18125:512-2437(-)
MPKSSAGKLNGAKRTGNASSNPDRTPTAKAKAGAPNVRSKATINRLNMYRTKVKRSKKGAIVKGGLAVGQTVKDMKAARVQPDRRWFGNTRVVGQAELQDFREQVEKTTADPYAVLLRRHKLPMGLLASGGTKKGRVDLLRAESYSSVFGRKQQRKRPKLPTAEIEELVQKATASHDKYDEATDSNLERAIEAIGPRNYIFDAGQSRRIRAELFKVIDSSDVIIEVLDARDPMGTRAPHAEHFIKKEASHKHVVFLLNKCDLVPTRVTAAWLKVLSKEAPTLAFHASITNPFGKGALINLLRQFAKLHSDKKQVSVGFIGYPNVGKSSVINTLKKKKVCKVAPIPGETKVWQYITLMKSIYLIDCPGTVQPSGNSEEEAVLKGVVRIEQLRHAEDYIEELLKRIKPEYVTRTYGIAMWSDHVDFLEQYGTRIGKLLKGGEPDTNAAAKLVLHDWQRGRLPYFVAPPDFEERGSKAAAAPEKSPLAANFPLPVRKQKLTGMLLAHEFVDEDAGEDDDDGVDADDAEGEGEEVEGEEESEEEEEEEQSDEDDEEEGDAGPVSAVEAAEVASAVHFGKAASAKAASAKSASAKAAQAQGVTAVSKVSAASKSASLSGSGAKRKAEAQAAPTGGAVSWEDVFDEL